MGDSRKPTALAADEHAKRMDPQRFAYISDDTYSAEEVELCTQVRAAGARRKVRLCRLPLLVRAAGRAN